LSGGAEVLRTQAGFCMCASLAMTTAFSEAILEIDTFHTLNARWPLFVVSVFGLGIVTIGFALNHNEIESCE